MDTDTETEIRLIDIGHPMYMGMFTDEGNMLVHEATSRVVWDGMSGAFQRRYLQGTIRERLNEIERTHGEVYDTEVRSAVAARINKELCEPMKWIQIDYFFDDMQ